MGKSPIDNVQSTRGFTRSMVAWEKKIEAVVKIPTHVQISSSTSSSAQEDFQSIDSHFSPPMPNPIEDSSLPFHSSSSQIPKSNLRSVKHHQSAIYLDPGFEYFKQRNAELNEQLQEHVRLGRHLKHEN